MDVLRLCWWLYTTRGEGLLLAPRGFGKSTVGTAAFAAWLILKDPNLRILINSSTATKAESFLRVVKTHLEENPVIQLLWGGQVDPNRWNQSEIYVKPRTLIAKEPSISAHGWSGAVVGYHYDVHLIDDLVNEDNARTKGMRNKLTDWYYMSLDPTLVPTGFRLNTGTHYHYADHYAHLKTQFKIDKETLAEADEQERKELKTLRPTKVSTFKAIKRDGTSLWPERFSIPELKRKRRRMGSVRFGAQFQNETELMKGKVFKEENMMFYQREAVDISTLRIYQGCDLAIGQEGHHDYFALITRGYDDKNHGYTLDVVHGRYSFREQCVMLLWKAGKTREEICTLLGIPDERLKIRDIMKLFKGQSPYSRRQWKAVKRIGVESVAYQKVLPETLLELTTDVPIIKVKQTVDKKTRMDKYSPRWENHMEYLPEDNSCDNLKDELLLFDEGDHDDLCDAAEICNSVAGMVYDDDADETESEVEARVFS